uniref:Uncharacterized protein n=1 Tax=Oryza barthii TaxID=65489 RepID=A0A0D3FUU7_9ORYZ
MDIELELEREALGTLAGQVSSYKVPWILVILAILPYHRNRQPCRLLAHGIFSFIDVLDDAECERLAR